MLRSRVAKRLGVGLAVVGALVVGGGCKKSTPAATGGGADPGTSTRAESTPGVASRGMGMDDPFARLSGDAPKSLNAGYKALKAKKYDDARAAFAEVVKAVPDYTAARFQELRAAALGGHFADVPDLWSELLARDFVAYAGRLDKPKDLAPLRAAPEWARVQAVEAATKTAYAAGLDKGFFFVARSRDVGAPKWNGKEAKIELKQEAYFYDPATQRYRRYTETDGQVFAINLSPDKKTLSFLVVNKLQGTDQGITMFAHPLGGAVNLTTLETTGPFKLNDDLAEVRLAFTAAGEPAWVHESGRWAWTFDTARTALTQIDDKTKIDDKTNVTVAKPASVAHSGEAPAGVKIGSDGKSIDVAGSDKPLRSARDLEASSLEWSPGKKRLVYAGAIDACKLVTAAKGAKPEKNELFLWDAEKKTASRVASAVSAFDSLWLDDDHLVYEGGVGKDGKLHVYQPSTRNDVTLKPRYGAGLFGFPTLSCEAQGDEGEGDAPLPDETTEGD